MSLYLLIDPSEPDLGHETSQMWSLSRARCANDPFPLCSFWFWSTSRTKTCSCGTTKPTWPAASSWTSRPTARSRRTWWSGSGYHTQPAVLIRAGLLVRTWCCDVISPDRKWGCRRTTSTSWPGCSRTSRCPRISTSPSRRCTSTTSWRCQVSAAAQNQNRALDHSYGEWCAHIVPTKYKKNGDQAGWIYTVGIFSEVACRGRSNIS